MRQYLIFKKGKPMKTVGHAAPVGLLARPGGRAGQRARRALHLSRAVDRGLRAVRAADVPIARAIGVHEVHYALLAGLLLIAMVPWISIGFL
jgi:hypothetical protein